MEGVLRGDIDWREVSHGLAAQGWFRLTQGVDRQLAAHLADAAPGPWSPLPECEGSAGVRQAGQTCHSDVTDAAEVVQSLAAAIREGIDGAAPAGFPKLPPFNHVEWCRPDEGRMFITPHRDPERAGGVVAVVTLRGKALFRVWDIPGTNADAERQPELAAHWRTGAGDIVVMRGGGWPTPTSRRPIHEAQQADGERITLTLRHNTGGFGADYFAP